MKIDDTPPRKERYLSDYNTAYLSDRYPLMAFLYAIYAGGEHTVYCDHAYDYNTANDYFHKYCIKPFEDKNLPVPDYIKQVQGRLAEFEKATEGRKKMVHADAGDWDLFLACLKIEMLANAGPSPIW